MQDCGLGSEIMKAFESPVIYKEWSGLDAAHSVETEEQRYREVSLDLTKGSLHVRQSSQT
jgi:hypothetical protein